MEKNALKKIKAKAVLECFEEIPCNPCQESCPQGAISIKGGIHSIPVLDEDKCIGCGICITHCSGQAIFVIESDGVRGKVSIPYEFLPYPQKGQIVDALNRDGAYICDGVIKSVKTSRRFDHTAVVTIDIPAEYTETIRNFRFKSGEV